MPIPSGRQRLIIGRFAEYLLASGALVVQTCRDIHELNIEIGILIPLHGKSLNFSTFNLNARPTLTR